MVAKVWSLLLLKPLNIFHSCFSYSGKFHSGPPPEGYICRRCHQSGHHVSNCPLRPDVIGPHIKRTTGIPHSFLTFTDDPLAPGALLTHQGQFAVPTIDA